MTKPDLKTIPTTPGIYFFKDSGDKIIYVGKAANLRNRLVSYWRASNGLTGAKQKLVDEAKTISWEEQPSEIEALLAEAYSIKKYRPYYNVLLRDDKTFLSVVITREDYPRILTTHEISGQGTYYGPFTDARAVKETLRLMRRFFPYRTSCKPNSGRLCLDAHLGLCPGVCGGRVSKAEYTKNIRHIKDFFANKKQKIIRDLKTELKKIPKKEVSDIATGKRARLEFMIRNLEKVIYMQKVLAFGEKAEGDIVELAKVLGLSRPPERIEGYDISNIFGSLTTASMVVFADGQPDKSQYRKFKIKTVRGANDFASMQEVLRRRFGKHLNVEGKQNWPKPDLVVIDGGRPQLSAAMQVWQELNLDIPLISLAKRLEEIYIPRELHPLLLPRSSGALHVLQRVRDESHRFAITYHKLIRRKKLIGR